MGQSGERGQGNNRNIVPSCSMHNPFLRHTVATIVYRFGRVMEPQQPSFGTLSLGKGTRTPAEIIRHMNDVLFAASAFVREGRFARPVPEEHDLAGEVERFLDTGAKLDTALADHSLDSGTAHRLLQGPLADVLTHIGQLAMMGRLNSNPVIGEDYSAATIDADTPYSQNS